MTPNFSVLHATYGRPEKAIQAMRLFFKRAASHPATIEYIFAINRDDPTAKEFERLLTLELDSESNKQVSCVEGDFHGSAPAWDAAAKASTGAILIQGQDDVEPPQDWDDLILARRHKGFSIISTPWFMAVSDGYRKDMLCCTAIMSRAYYEMEGCFLCPEYISVYSDDDATYRAFRNARDGKSEFISAREIIFLHRHHYHDKSVPFDETYSRENSASAYRVGEKLFRERNPRAATDGLKTW